MLNADNDFLGPLALSGAAASVVARHALILGPVRIAGNLTITAAEDITQLSNSSLNTGGKAVISSAFGLVTLSTSGNSFGGGLTRKDRRPLESPAPLLPSQVLVNLLPSSQPVSALSLPLELPIAVRAALTVQPASGQVEATASSVAISTPAAPLAAQTSGAPQAVSAPGELVLRPVATTGVNTAAASTPRPTAVTTDGGDGFVVVQTFEPVIVPAGSNFSFTLPAQTFQHADATVPVQLVAQTAQGQSLPDWLRFDPATQRFEGTPPSGIAQIEVVITATDPDGRLATTSLVLQFSPS